MLRQDRRRRRPRLATGSAIWSSPQAFYLLVPLAVWLAGHVVRTRRWSLLRAAPYGAFAAVVGGLPWLWTNAQTRLASLQRPITPVTTVGQRLSLYNRIALPQVSGFKLPYNPTEWIGSRAFLVPHLGLVLLVMVAAVLLARRAPWVPLALVRLRPALRRLRRKGAERRGRRRRPGFSGTRRGGGPLRRGGD
ncbi:MAG: hypothetical protein WKF86_09015 [Acidimicrobiales bacterium]